MPESLLFAHSVEEAISLKTAGSAFLAGGTEINRLNTSVDAPVLIAIRKLEELSAVTEEGDTVWIGAAVTFQRTVEHPLIPDWFKEACRMMVSRTKRNMATVGGNIALLRDDSYIMPALLAARASIVYADKDGTETCVDICGYMDARRAGKLNDALILRVGLPTGRKICLKRYANTAMSHSVLNIAYGASSGGKDISIGLAAKNCGLFCLEQIAAAIEADPSADEETVMTIVNGAGSPAFSDDMFGSADYKRYLLAATLSRMTVLSR